MLSLKNGPLAWVAAPLVLAVVISLAGCTGRSHPPVTQSDPPDAEEIRDAIVMLSQKNKQQKMIPNVWLVAADRLAQADPATAKAAGADTALEKFIATTKDKDAKEAAQKALAKISGQESVSALR